MYGEYPWPTCRAVNEVYSACVRWDRASHAVPETRSQMAAKRVWPSTGYTDTSTGT